MSKPSRLYEVWFSRGAGLQPGPRFRIIEDARRYVAVHRTEASWAIRTPAGEWESFRRRAPVLRDLDRASMPAR
jgi:hypothetical protein